MVVDVEGRTLQLKGSAEQQYAEWRMLLKQLYENETGLPATVGAARRARRRRRITERPHVQRHDARERAGSRGALRPAAQARRGPHGRGLAGARPRDRRRTRRQGPAPGAVVVARGARALPRRPRDCSADRCASERARVHGRPRGRSGARRVRIRGRIRPDTAARRRAARDRGRAAAASRRRAGPCTRAAACTATSRRRTCCSPPTDGCCSRTSASPPPIGDAAAAPGGSPFTASPEQLAGRAARDSGRRLFVRRARVRAPDRLSAVLSGRGRRAVRVVAARHWPRGVRACRPGSSGW